MYQDGDSHFSFQISWWHLRSPGPNCTSSCLASSSVQKPRSFAINSTSWKSVNRCVHAMVVNPNQHFEGYDSLWGKMPPSFELPPNTVLTPPSEPPKLLAARVKTYLGRCINVESKSVDFFIFLLILLRVFSRGVSLRTWLSKMMHLMSHNVCGLELGISSSLSLFERDLCRAYIYLYILAEHEHR